MSTKDELLTVADVAAELGVPRSTVYYWRQCGSGPRSIKYPNGEIRFRRSALDAWLCEREEAA